MRVELGFFLNIERAPGPELRESDIASTATERLPEFEEGVQGPESARRPRIGFQGGAR